MSAPPSTLVLGLRQRPGDAPGLGRGACRRGNGLRIGAGVPRRRRPAASPEPGWRQRPGEAPGLGRGACRRGDRLRIGAGAPRRRRPAASPGLG